MDGVGEGQGAGYIDQRWSEVHKSLIDHGLAPLRRASIVRSRRHPSAYPGADTRRVRATSYAPSTVVRHPFREPELVPERIDQVHLDPAPGLVAHPGTCVLVPLLG